LVEVLHLVEQLRDAAPERLDPAASRHLLARVRLELPRPAGPRLQVEPEDEVAHVGVEAALDRDERLLALLHVEILDLELRPQVESGQRDLEPLRQRDSPPRRPERRGAPPRAPRLEADVAAVEELARHVLRDALAEPVRLEAADAPR